MSEKEQIIFQWMYVPCNLFVADLIIKFNWPSSIFSGSPVPNSTTGHYIIYLSEVYHIAGLILREHGCISWIGLSWPITANLVVWDNRNLFSYSRGGQESETKMSAEPGSVWSLLGRIFLCILRPLVTPGIPWLVAHLCGLCLSLYIASFPTSLCVFCFSVSYKNTCPWTYGPPWFRMILSSDL